MVNMPASTSNNMESEEYKKGFQAGASAKEAEIKERIEGMKKEEPESYKVFNSKGAPARHLDVFGYNQALTDLSETLTK